MVLFGVFTHVGNMALKSKGAAQKVAKVTEAGKSTVAKNVAEDIKSTKLPMEKFFYTKNGQIFFKQNDFIKKIVLANGTELRPSSETKPICTFKKDPNENIYIWKSFELVDMEGKTVPGKDGKPIGFYICENIANFLRQNSTAAKIVEKEGNTGIHVRLGAGFSSNAPRELIENAQVMHNDTASLRPLAFGEYFNNTIISVHDLNKIKYKNFWR